MAKKRYFVSGEFSNKMFNKFNFCLVEKIDLEEETIFEACKRFIIRDVGENQAPIREILIKAFNRV